MAQGTSPKVPSSGPIIVLLYAGKEDPTSLDSCLHANYPHLSSMVVAVDILRSGPKGDHDMLQPELYGDSILILRQMYITSLARASRAAVSLPGPRSFLEHPEDPVVSSSLPKAKECSSFWITEEGQLWMEENSLTAISFDQCRLGQLVKKATTLATDLPIQDWDQMRCTYPWDMMAGLAKAMAVSLAAPGHIRKASISLSSDTESVDTQSDKEAVVLPEIE